MNSFDQVNRADRCLSTQSSPSALQINPADRCLSTQSSLLAPGVMFLEGTAAQQSGVFRCMQTKLKFRFGIKDILYTTESAIPKLRCVQEFKHISILKGRN